MLPNLSNQRQLATHALTTVATDLCLLPTGDSRSTWHLPRTTILIPSSPASGIMPRIFGGNLPRVGSDNPSTHRRLLAPMPADALCSSP